MRRFATALVVAAIVLACGAVGARRRPWVRQDCGPTDPIVLENDSRACLADAPRELIYRDKSYRDCMMGKGWRVQRCEPTSAPPDVSEETPAGTMPADAAPPGWTEITAPDGTRILYNKATGESVIVPE